MTTETATTLLRAPLSTLAMSAAQERPRRTSARMNDSTPDDAEPPAKKARTDKNARAPPKPTANGRKGGAGKDDYDHNEGGFTFKKRTKKAVVDDGASTSNSKAPAPEPRQQQQRPQQSTAAETSKTTEKEAPTRGRKRKTASLDGAADVQPQPPPPEPPRRRSKRISAETQPAQPAQQQQSQLAAQPDGNERLKSPEAMPAPQQRGRKRTSREGTGNEIHVERKRGPLKIALPFADTPVIQRNKDMRKSSGENRRRSSSLMRGRRASNLMDSGTSNALPHDSVDTADLYKHINPDMPEPRRMKQLMTWCGARALPARPGADAKGADVSAALTARTIQDELLADIVNNPEMTDWSNRPDDIAPVVLVKKPNPRNIANAAKLAELEAEVSKLEEEKASWDRLTSSLSTGMAEAQTSFPTSTDSSSPSAPLDTSALQDADQESHAALLTWSSTTTSAARARFDAAASRLEFTVDALAAGMHRLAQLDGAVAGTAARVGADASDALRERSRRDGGEAHGVGDLLRAFGRAGGGGAPG